MEASLPASHNSPGPPDRALHGATKDEDSQESMTLQNALGPLPDTQRDSSEHALSSPTERDGGVQLLSRPQNLDVDPGKSFFWGKPVKIIPGQFSRPVPAKSMADATKEKGPTIAPIGDIASDSGQPTSFTPMEFSHAISPNSRRLAAEESSDAALPSIEGGLSSEENKQPVASNAESLARFPSSARRPPFEDYQPRHRGSDGRDQASVTHPSPARQLVRPEGFIMVETQDHGLCQIRDQVPPQDRTVAEQRRESHHSVSQPSQQDKPANTFQTNEPRHRMSFPNDTSVSPAQVSQQLPRETSQHGAPRKRVAQKNALGKASPLNVNRPMREVRGVTKTKTPSHCPSSRSSMHGSNISKRRSDPRRSASRRPRPSRHQSARHHDDTPSIRRRDRQFVANYRSPPMDGSQQSNEAPEIDMVAANLAQAFNSNFEMMRNGWRQKDQEISYLAHNFRKQEEKLSNFKKQSEGKSGRIQELENDRVQLQERLESANQQLEDRFTKMSDLEKKCRTYKEHLNSAIAEQQDLYKAAKAKCETSIKQMREEEHKRKALDEQQRKDLQATRERLTQVVKSTVAEYSLKEREFNDKLESLHQRIQEREADVERERETIQSLLQQNATVESIQGAVKTFEAQIEQINAKLGEIASDQFERDGTAAEETRAKLDKIVEHLSALDKRVEPQERVIEKIQEVNVQTLSTILNPVIKSQTETQAKLQKLSDSVEDYMEDFWMKLEDREDVLTELLEQTQADNAQLQADVQLKEDECNVLLDRLEQCATRNRQQEKDLDNLKTEIAELERAQANDIEHTNSLHEDCEKLRADIATKAAVASNLEIKLQQSQVALQNATKEHDKHTQELHKLMKQRVEAAQATQTAAVEVARQEVTRDMGIAQQNINTLLRQADSEVMALKNELNATKKHVSMLEEKNKRFDATVEEMRSDLGTAQAKATKLGEQASEKDTEIQNVIDHSSTQVADLEAKVASKEKEIAQLSENAQAYGKQVQKALDSLKEWTKGHQAVNGFTSELGKAQDGDLDSLDPKLRAFLEIDMLHQAIFQYCQSRERSAQKCGRGTAEESTAGKDVWADLPPSSPPEQMPPKNLVTRVLDRVGRHVTIRSPIQSAPSPVPLSVSAEQEHRRSAIPPRSIMKASSQSTTVEDESTEPRAPAQSSTLPSRGVFGRRMYKTFALAARQGDEEQREQGIQDKGAFARSDFTRAPYNRPVSGNDKPRVESIVNRDKSRVGRETKKRMQADQGMVSPTKRARVDTKKPLASMAHHSSPPESQIIQGDEFQNPPSAPRKGRKNTNILGESISPVRSSHFKQGAQTSDRDATRRGHNHRGAKDMVLVGSTASLARRANSNSNSQDGSQDSQPLYYPRHRSAREKEDSQESIAYSQRVEEPASPPFRPKRFTMGL